MRTLTVTEFMSLDGVVQDPMWTFPYWNDEIAKFKAEETTPNDVLLLGRVTYEGFAQAWPPRGLDAESGGIYFNPVRKYVISNTLDKVEWQNSVLVKGDVVEEVKKLKAQDGENLVVHGSIMLAQTLLQAGLVDTVRLLVYPVVLGKGKRLFHDGFETKFNRVDARVFSSGVTGLIYEPVRE
jgi:dihydrofolate reductase